MPDYIVTTLADFVTDSPIPNMSEVSGNVTNFINKYEPKLFTILLGSALYTALKASPTDARFVAIIEPYLHPAAVSYTFFYYTRRVSTQMLNNGAAQSKNKNAKPASVWPVMVENWNDMVKLNRALYKFLYNNPDYPEFVPFMPSWFFGWGLWAGAWGYGFFDWNDWDGEFGVCVPEEYRYKNRLGL